MTPMILAHLLIILACIKIGYYTGFSEISPPNSLCMIEKDGSFITRLTTLLAALVGLYPQYRALRTVLMGWGWIKGDWEVDHKYNNRNLYVIEPLVESLLQVYYLFLVFG